VEPCLRRFWWWCSFSTRCAGGDSFGAILGDFFRGVASAPGASARAVVEDLIDVLERIPDEVAAGAPRGAPRRFATAVDRRRAEDEQLALVDRLESMRSKTINALATAKADEAAAKAANDVDSLLDAVERAAGLDAKKKACEHQLKIARRELDEIQRAVVGGSYYDEVGPPPPTTTTSPSREDAAPPPKKKKKKKKAAKSSKSTASSEDSSSRRRETSSSASSSRPSSAPPPPPHQRRDGTWSNPYKERVDWELLELKKSLRGEDDQK